MTPDVRPVHGDDPITLDALLAVRRTLGAMVHPDDPPIGLDELTRRVRQQRAHHPEQHFVALLGSEPAGALELSLEMDANEDQVEVEIGVVPDLRQHGVGSGLLRAALDLAPPARTRVLAASYAGHDGFFAARGLHPKALERVSRLDVTSIDRTRLRQRVEDAPAAASGYELRCWHGPCPDELVEAVCHALAAMEDQPLEDLTYDIAAVEPSTLRDRERSAEGIYEPYWALALAPDGTPAGVTYLRVNLHRPSLAEQEDTGVLPLHRGKRLGMWLKAANLLRAIDACPELAVVETSNAESNRWMLAVNEELGFRPHGVLVNYQGGRTDVAARVS